MSNFKQYFDVYEFKCELPGSKEIIKFKPLKTQDIKKLLAYENVDDYREIENVLDEMIKLSVLNENFNIDDLYLQDRFFLLTEIRKKTKGEFLEFEFSCPNENCQSQTLIVLNLEDLKLVKLDKRKNIDNIIKLNDQISIEIWHITRGQEKESINKSKNQNINSSEIQFNIITQGINSIITPDGKEENLSFEDKMYIIDNMTMLDLKEISNWYEKNTFGVDFTIEKICKHCGYKEISSIPLHNFFF